MSKEHLQIKAALRKMVTDDSSRSESVEVISGYVKSVDEDACTIDVMPYVDGELMEGVFLRGSDESAVDGVVIFPAVDSDVVIASVDGPGEWCLMRASKVAKVKITIGGTTLVMDKDTVVVNGGSNNGLVKVAPLTARLNKLESALTELIGDYNSHTHLGVQSGASTSGPTLSTYSKTVSQTAQADIENTKVKH